MNLRRILAISLLLSFAVFARIAAQTLINVAYRTTVSVQYAVDSLIAAKPGNPSAMVDNSVTYFSLAAGQEGTSITMDLGATARISSITIKSLTSAFRLRGFKWLTSLDSIVWTQVLDTLNESDAVFSVAVSPLYARYSKIVVTQMAPYGREATLITEIRLLGFYVDPAVYGLSLLGSSATGARYNDIEWSSANLDASTTLTISMKKNGSNDPETIITHAAQNTGRFAWETSRIPDGTYEIFVRPNVASPKIDGYCVGTIRNFTDTKAFLADSVYEYARSISIPWGYSALMGDSVSLSWRFTPRISRVHSFNLYHSVHSGREWIKLATLTDSAARSAVLPAPTAPTTEDSVFFRIGIVADSVELTSTQTRTPVILSACPSKMLLRWRALYSPRDRSAGSGSLMAFRSGNGAARIMGGADWLLDGDGVALPGWTSTGRLFTTPAADDLDGDGIVELVTNRIAREDRSRTWSSTDNAPTWEGIQIVGSAGAGKKQLVFSQISSLRITGDTLQFLQNIVFPQTRPSASHVGAEDLNNDGSREFVYAVGNRLYAVDSGAVLLPGFPVEFPEVLHPWVLLVDFDRTGQYEILCATATRFYCITNKGIPRSGFPVVVPTPAVTPSLADLNGDGHVEVLLAAMKWEWNGARSRIDRVAVIHSIDRLGTELPGWPSTVNTSIDYMRIIMFDTFMRIAMPDIFPGEVVTPLIASIDGDAVPEIILSSTNGMIYVLNADGSLRPGYPVFVGTQFMEIGVLGDFDNDGSLNYVVRSDRDEKADAELLCLDFGPGSYNPNCIPWPMHLQNPARTGMAPLPTVGVNDGENVLPAEFALEQNYPNPFNPETVVRYRVPVVSPERVPLGRDEGSVVSLRIYDALGREIATLVNEVQQPGSYQATWNAAHVPSGIYFYRLMTNGKTLTRKMVVVR